MNASFFFEEPEDNLINMARRFDIDDEPLKIIAVLLNFFAWFMPRLFLHSLYWGLVAALAYFGFISLSIPFLSTHEFEALGCEMFHTKNFKLYFGVHPIVVSKLWRELYYNGSLSFKASVLFYSGVGGPKPVHLLWALLHLRQKFQEEMFAHDLDVPLPEFRKWSWLYANGIASLAPKFVVWKNRLPRSCDFISYSKPFVSVDALVCEFCKVDLPWDPIHPTFFMLYEVAISIRTGEVVAFSGPFDEFPVGNIFRAGLKQMLEPNELVAADSTYAGERVVERGRSVAASHEILFARLKSWDVLGKPFIEKSVDKHRIAFEAVLVVEQIRGMMLVEFVSFNEEANEAD